MKRLLFILSLLISTTAFAQGPTYNAFSRIDTLTGAFKACYFGGVGGNFRYTAVATTQTADIRIAFTWRDTTAQQSNGRLRGLLLPYISGSNPSWGVPQVHTSADTVWVSGAANDIIVHAKY